MIITENTGNLEPISKFVQLRNAVAAVSLQVFSMGNIVGCMHIIPEIPTSGETGDGWSGRWIVNRHIDLVTWNYAYT